MKLLIKKPKKPESKTNKVSICPEHYTPHHILLEAYEANYPILLTKPIADGIRAFCPIIQKESKEWVLLYSLGQDGASLNTLLAKCGGIQDPCVLVINDSRNNLFGAYLSEPLVYNKSFYGNGTTFLWKSTERGIKGYLTSGINENYIYTESAGQKFIAIGSR
jgi:hypothetical protein